MGRVTRILLATVVAVAGLAGCTSPTSGLIVNGETVLTVADVGAIRQAYTDVVEPMGYSPLSDDEIITGYAQGAVASHLIELFGLELDDSEVVSSLNELGVAVYSNPTTSGYVTAVLKWSTIQYQMAQAGLDDSALTVLLDGLDVEVNPRYGQWSNQTLSLVNVGLALAEPLTTVV
ncbi:MAG: hypothetical protein LBK42_07715 [Propionibacteriaceae bacterium]|jgi:hypothetical protein|nr:hypothetical protein [Propionibacteriaceae bacterium]